MSRAVLGVVERDFDVVVDVDECGVFSFVNWGSLVTSTTCALGVKRAVSVSLGVLERDFVVFTDVEREERRVSSFVGSISGSITSTTRPSGATTS